MKKCAVLMSLLLCSGSGAAIAADVPAAAAAGKNVFEIRCAPCHAAGLGGDPGRDHLPGTDALRIKYKGTTVPALLERRTDLTEPVLKVYLRHGSWSMPPFRKTEVSDADIANLAAYFAVTSLAAERK
jgi:mono/diheme cytochrome c family protein